MKILTTRIPDESYQKVKIVSASELISVSDFVRDAIEEKLVNVNTLNTLNTYSLNTLNTYSLNALNTYSPKEETKEDKEKETKEKKQKKGELKETGESKEEISPTTTTTARARGELPFPDPLVEAAGESRRPTEAECIAAGATAGVPEEAVREWLEHMRKFDWRFHSGGRVTIANFRTSLMKWRSREKRTAGGTQIIASGKTNPTERKKPSWMTWEQWQFEEAERMRNARRNEKVERVGAALEKVRKEFGIC